jgi:hypothetical protein
MMSRTVAIVITAVTTLFCGCSGLILSVWGVIFGIGGLSGSGEVEINGVTSALDPTSALATGGGAICVGIILIIIPIVVGFITLRNAKAA